MDIEIKEYCRDYIEGAADVWNEVVEEGNAFPQDEPLGLEEGHKFFSSQTYTGVCFERESNETVGLYILHPNNVGRCGHICNASYAVKGDMRGRHIGEALVSHCVKTAREKGYRILQFNAVVRSNAPALNLYRKLGFTQLGVIPNGFLMKNGEYEDIIPHYIEL